MNPYALMDEFSIKEAVQAITGIVQPKSPEEKNTVGLIESVIRRAIDEKKIEVAVIEKHGVREERIGMRRVGINDTRDHRPIVLHPYTETIIRIARADLVAWCESRGIRPKLLFADHAPDCSPPSTGDDLSGYHTPALKALRAAIINFWLHHDPKRPPKKTEIVDWLMKEHGMTNAMAESIDRIIRPELYREGGNR